MKLSVDEKCDKLCNIIFDCFSHTIPSAHVVMTSRDKPYITPTLKLLINQRWSAYRQRNFQQYRHLNVKIKEMLLKEKRKWASSAKNSSKEL